VGRIGLLGALLAALAVAGCERTESVQRGGAGTSQIQLYKPGHLATLEELNKIPPPEDPADP
jgi:hypothetical protein